MGSVVGHYRHLMAAEGVSGWDFDFELTMLGHRLVQILDQLGSPLPSPVYVGISLDNSFNASTYPVDGGHIVLVNRYLGALFGEMARLMARRFDIRELPGDRLSVTALDDDPSADGTGSVARLLTSYVLGASPTLGALEPPTPLGPQVQTWADELAEYARVFIVLHEFGHIFGEHAADGAIVEPLTAAARISRVRGHDQRVRAMRREVDADMFALAVISRLMTIEIAQSPGTGAVRAAQMYMAGLVFFLELEGMLARTAALNSAINRAGRREGEESATHPPASRRMYELLKLAAVDFDEDCFAVAAVVSRQMRAYERTYETFFETVLGAGGVGDS